jgi:tripartite-type tricarboxylate transporter receptor subunit TctC
MHELILADRLFAMSGRRASMPDIPKATVPSCRDVLWRDTAGRLSRRERIRPMKINPLFRYLPRVLVVSTLAAALVQLPSRAMARDFPVRQVQLVVPFAAGGAVDVAARLFALKLAAYWGQPVIVENRPGGSTTIAAKQVAQGNPDGYSLLFTLGDTFAVVPYLAQHRTFQPMNDLVPINLLAKIVNAIVINPSLPIENLPALVEHARAHPTALRYGSAGLGSNIHLTMETLKSVAKIDIQHVPYRGLAPALTATVANEVQITVAGHSARDLIESGRVRAIAIAAQERMPAFPKVPTTGEAGYGKVDSSSYLIIAAPAKTPLAIVNTINEDLSRALNEPEFRKQLTEAYGHVVTNIGGSAAIQQLERLAQASAETVRISGADKE